MNMDKLYQVKLWFWLIFWCLTLKKMTLTLSQGHPTNRNWRPILVVHVHQIFKSQLFFSLDYAQFIIFFGEIKFLAWPWPLTPEKNVCPSLFFLGVFFWCIYMSKDSEKPWYETIAICFGYIRNLTGLFGNPGVVMTCTIFDVSMHINDC